MRFFIYCELFIKPHKALAQPCLTIAAHAAIIFYYITILIKVKYYFLKSLHISAGIPRENRYFLIVKTCGVWYTELYASVKHRKEPDTDMKKDCIISIKGLQQVDDPDTDEVTLTTEGRFYRKPGGYYLVYDESEISGLEDTRTTVKVSGDNVTVTRSGKYPSLMTFQPDRRHMGMYYTDMGNLTISVATRSVRNELTDDGGRVTVDYDIEFQHAYMSTNNLTIDVRVPQQ
ncbi:MAG: DUF1934 domain-containing protein [Ruminococcaceae bacterium]|nr:DUF1934 domain-containing protein [Oscillospiraceae bacterium]